MESDHEDVAEEKAPIKAPTQTTDVPEAGNTIEDLNDIHIHVDPDIVIRRGKVKDQETEPFTPSNLDQMMKQLEALSLEPDRSEEFMTKYAENLQAFYRITKIIEFYLSPDWSELSSSNEVTAQHFITSFSPKLFRTAEAIQQVFDEWITTTNIPPTEVIVKQSEWCATYIEKLDNLRSICREIAGARFCSTYLPLQSQSLYKRYATSSQEDLALQHREIESDSYAHKKFGNKSRYEENTSVAEVSQDNPLDSDAKTNLLLENQTYQHEVRQQSAGMCVIEKSNEATADKPNSSKEAARKLENTNTEFPHQPGTLRNTNSVHKINTESGDQSNQLIQAVISALSQISNTQQSNPTLPQRGAQSDPHSNTSVQPQVVMAAPITMEPLSIPDFPGVMEEYHNWKDFVVTTMDEMRLSYSLRTKYIWSKLDKDTKRRLQHIDINATDSHSALWRELDLMFDRKELLKTHCISRLLELASWKETT